MEPGFSSRARARAAGVRKRYSPRSASAPSRRPTMRSAQFATTRGSTSLAVCCAPTRITPSERPRSAMSSSTSLIGLRPSRGAYLFSSSSTTKVSGLAEPVASFSSNIRFSTTPTTNRFARSCSWFRSITVTFLRRQSIACERSSSDACPRISGPRCGREASSLRRKACTVPTAARPAQWPSSSGSVISVICSTSSSNVCTSSPPICTVGASRGSELRAASASRASTDCTT